MGCQVLMWNCVEQSEICRVVRWRWVRCQEAERDEERCFGSVFATVLRTTDQLLLVIPAVLSGVNNVFPYRGQQRSPDQFVAGGFAGLAGEIYKGKQYGKQVLCTYNI
jgi:hypothetical protein